MAPERFPAQTTGNGPADKALAQVKRVLDSFMGRHDNATRRLAASTLAGTTTAIALNTTAVNIEHGFGRPWRGWRVIDKDAAQDIYRGTTVDDTKYITLRSATGAVNAVIEVW